MKQKKKARILEEVEYLLKKGLAFPLLTVYIC